MSNKEAIVKYYEKLYKEAILAKSIAASMSAEIKERLIEARIALRNEQFEKKKSDNLEFQGAIAKIEK